MEQTSQTKKAIGAENFVFLFIMVAFFGFFGSKMGLMNTINTMMNTAYALLLETVLYLLAVCVIMGALSSLFSEFGVVSLADRLLTPFMKPLYDLPGAASLGVVTTFFSDNPAILSLADDAYFCSLFKRYQLTALTNLGTAFGMGLIVCTYMLSLSSHTGQSYALAVAIGLLGTVVGSIVSTRLMMVFTKRLYGTELCCVKESSGTAVPTGRRPIRQGGAAVRAMGAMLEGGESGVKMGLGIIPGVLIICTVVMMLTNGAPPDGVYTGAAYEGIAFLPAVAERCSAVLTPLFGFSSPEAVGVPITALGSAGAAITMVAHLVAEGLADGGDVAVFTAMCMCWSGYLSTHVSMMNCLNSNELIGKAILSHTVGGLCAGISANWLYLLVQLLVR